MGWASASGVFDMIFKPLQKLYDEGNMPAETLKEVAKIVISTFEDSDWDTQDESVETFEGCDPIIEAFNEVSPWLFESDEYDSDLGFL